MPLKQLPLPWVLQVASSQTGKNISWIRVKGYKYAIFVFFCCFCVLFWTFTDLGEVIKCFGIKDLMLGDRLHGKEKLDKRYWVITTNDFIDHSAWMSIERGSRICRSSAMAPPSTIRNWLYNLPLVNSYQPLWFLSWVGENGIVI